MNNSNLILLRIFDVSGGIVSEVKQATPDVRLDNRTLPLNPNYINCFSSYQRQSKVSTFKNTRITRILLLCFQDKNIFFFKKGLLTVTKTNFLIIFHPSSSADASLLKVKVSDTALAPSKLIEQ